MQPFLAVGLRLKEYGHRVRIASHAQHRSFVEQFGMEFYPLGGDSQVLADFAVQSKGWLFLGTAFAASIRLHKSLMSPAMHHAILDKGCSHALKGMHNASASRQIH